MAATGNTASLSTNFNVSPYYDDFDETKNFHRILYRPGQAVQARELTQMQTMLQNQIDRFGEHMFKEGSIVRGCAILLDKEYYYVKLRDLFGANTVDISQFVGREIHGKTSGVTANVINTSSGSEGAAPETRTLFIKYTSSGANGQVKNFANNEIISTRTSKVVTSDEIWANTITTAIDSTGAYGTGSAITIKEGIIYAKDHFIRFPEQTIVLDKYSNKPTYRVGANIVETVVSSIEDTSLLDPARGSYNYAAPGANRLKLTPVLKKVARRSGQQTVANNFITLATLTGGRFEAPYSKPTYNMIRDYVASRTSEESGDYIVRGWEPRIKEHLKSGTNGGHFTTIQGGDATKLVIGIAPGKGYVRGYRVENLVTLYSTLNKGTDTAFIEDHSISSSYGNFTYVDEVMGSCPIDTHAVVSLRDTARNVVSTQGVSSAGAAGSEIGTARVRAMVYYSGTKGAADGQYRLYLYNIKMSSGNFSNVKSLYYNQASLSDFHADIVLDNSLAVLRDTNFNKAVFSAGAPAMKTFANNTSGVNSNTKFSFWQSESITIPTDTSWTTTLTGTGQEYLQSTGVLTSTQKENQYTIITNAAANTVPMTGYIGANAGTNKYTIQGNTAIIPGIQKGDWIWIGQTGSGGYGNAIYVEAVNGSGYSILGSEAANTAISGKPWGKYFPTGTVISLSTYGDGNGSYTSAAAQRQVYSNTSTKADFYLRETLGSTVSATLLSKIKQVTSTAVGKVLKDNYYVNVMVNQTGVGTIANTTGPWDLGVSDGFNLRQVRYTTSNTTFTSNSQGTDVTSSFTLDSGMTDNLYEHAKLRLKSSASHTPAAGDSYLVKFDYFTHDVSGATQHSYFTVDSYPVNDSGPSSSQIYTQQIPIYNSTASGENIDLRDAIDIRPRIADRSTPVQADVSGGLSLTATDNTTAACTNITTSGSGLQYPTHDNIWEADIEYYLKRKDLVAITKTGLLRVIKGTPTRDRLARSPQKPKDAIVLAKLNIAPYPSLPSDTSRIYGRPDLAVSVEPVRQRRFTMKDIGALQKRIDNLEYYTSLTLLQESAQDLFIASSTGTDRFKNGIIVDNFTNHRVGNVTHEDYKIAIDKGEKEARPTFRLDNVPLIWAAGDSSFVVSTSNNAVLTMDNTSKVFSNGETITLSGGGGISAYLDYQVNDSINGNKLYLSNTTGTFTTGTVTGGTSGTSDTVSSIRFVDKGKYLTLPYSQKLTATQPFATTTRNITGLVFEFAGQAVLDPSSDNWVDTTIKPDLLVDFDLGQQNWETMANAWGSVFGDWNTLNSGQVVDTSSATSGRTTTTTTTTTTTEEQLREGVRFTAEPTTDNVTLGDRLLDVSLAPFMRSRVINIVARGLKPTTRHFSFFDREGVSDYVTPANTSYTIGANTAVEGAGLMSDDKGRLSCTFRLPNEEGNRFRVGDKYFRLTDAITNDTLTCTSSAEGLYSARGLDATKEGTMITTRSAELSTETVSETRTVIATNTDRSSITATTPDVGAGGVPDQGGDDGPGDDGDGACKPVAQTFKLYTYSTDQDIPVGNAGAFLSRIDVYFQDKDPDFGFQLQIREVDPTSTMISNKFMPFGIIDIEPEDVNLSDDGTVPTPMFFPTPIYLLEDREYAFIFRAHGETPRYNLWISRLGETDIKTGERVTMQPYLGGLWDSQNNITWTAIQEEDVKFDLYTCDFDTSLTGTAKFYNASIDMLSLNRVSDKFSVHGETVESSYKVTLSGAPVLSTVADPFHESTNTVYMIGGTSGANASVANINSTVVTLRHTPGSARFANSETVSFKHANGTSANASLSLSTTSTGVPASVNTGKVWFYDDKTTSNTILHIANTSGVFPINTWVVGQSGGQYAKILEVQNLSAHVLQPKISTIQLSNTSVVLSGKFAKSTTAMDASYNFVNNTEDTTFKSSPKYVMSNTNEAAAGGITNSVDLKLELTSKFKKHSPCIDLDRSSLTVVENLINDDTTGETGAYGGSALARYITKTVALADGNDAEDLVAYITAFKPSTGTISVYYRLLNAEDNDDINDHAWVQMSQDQVATLYSDNEDEDDYKEFTYSVPTANLTGSSNEVQYINNSAVTFTGFKFFAVKVVLTTSNPANPPKMKDFRAIALQI